MFFEPSVQHIPCNFCSIVKFAPSYLSSSTNAVVPMEIGSTWEEKAFLKYKCVMQSEKHTNHKVMKSGLFISDSVILGASPDGLNICDCHSNGVLEIKCAIKF